MRHGSERPPVPLLKIAHGEGRAMRLYGLQRRLAAHNSVRTFGSLGRKWLRYRTFPSDSIALLRLSARAFAEADFGCE
jgi:hypothetical protein